jgi:outer membrane protein assembly factor BamD
MPRAKLSVVCLCLLALAACSSNPEDKTANQSPQRIYADAQEEMKAGGWDRAIPLLEKLEGRAAGTPLAQQAELDKAYAQYKTAEPAQAVATLDRFMKLHPASPAYDYALYLKGVVNFNDDLGIFSFISEQDVAERDQKASKEAFEAFKELVTRFPDSRYTPDARQRMIYIVNNLAQYEVHVARFYYSRGAYLAAINRCQLAINDYREAPALEEALFVLMKSYDALGMAPLRDDTKRVLVASYPNSDFLKYGARVSTPPWWKVWELW